MGYRLAGSSVHDIFQARILEWDSISSWDQEDGIQPLSSALAGGFFITELPGKPVFGVRG